MEGLNDPIPELGRHEPKNAEGPNDAMTAAEVKRARKRALQIKGTGDNT